MRTALAVAMIVVLAGCQSLSPNAKVAAAEGATKGSSTKLADFEVGLPQGWTVFDLAAKDFDKIVDEWAKKDPKNAQLADPLRAVASQGQIKLMAFDFTPADKTFTDNLNVIVTPAPPGGTLGQYTEASAGQLKQIAVGPVKMGKGSYNGQEYGVADYGMGSGAQPKLAVKCFFTVNNNKAYTFTFTCLASRAGAFQAQSETAMASVSLK